MSLPLATSMCNRFIAIEGIDGVGKSTIVQGIASHLRSAGYAVRLFQGLCHPFRNLRSEIRDVHSVYARYLFYLASNAAISSVVRERITDEWIVCDRYVYTTQAYHIGFGLKHPIPLEEMDLELPQHSFWIKLASEDIRQRRLADRGRFSPDDSLLRTGRGILDRVEEVYREHGLFPVDNSGSDPALAVSRILDIVLAKDY
jgi:thymidylate kinase